MSRLRQVIDMVKARVDEGLSPQRKASQRAKRNSRSINTPDGEHKRYFKFQGKNGAMAGKRGEKVRGKKKMVTGAGVHHGASGRSAAGVMGEQASKHKGTARGAWNKRDAVKLHTKKLGELRGMKKPNLPKSHDARKSMGTWIKKARQFGEYQTGVDNNTGKKGVSIRGTFVRRGKGKSGKEKMKDKHSAKKQTIHTIRQNRQMKKPNLP